MLKKLLYTFVLFISSTSYANEPKDWQLGFQKPASQSMYEIVKFHDYMLVPIIVAISGFVLFLMAYTCIRFRASRNPNPSKRTHNVAVEILALGGSGKKTICNVARYTSIRIGCNLVTATSERNPKVLIH